MKNKKEEIVGVTPDAVEVDDNIVLEDSRENPETQPGDDYIVLNKVRARAKEKAAKLDPQYHSKTQAVANETSIVAETAKAVETTPEPEEEPEIVGHTADGSVIFEAKYTEPDKKPEEAKTATDDNASTGKSTDEVIPDVTRALPKVVVDFRAELAKTRKTMVEMAGMTYKSKVYGHMVVESAESMADFIDRVLTQTSDVKFIAKAVEGMIINPSLKDPEIFDKVERYDFGYRPNDVEKDLWDTCFQRSVKAMQTMFTEIRKETFETDVPQHRVAMFIKWALDNTLFFTTDGPEGHEVGY